MTITFTVTIDDASGSDTSLFFPGSIPINMDSTTSSPTNPSVNYYITGDSSTYRLTFAGEFTSTDLFGGLDGAMTSAILYEDRRNTPVYIPLMHLDIDFGDSGLTSIPVSNGFALSPDSLLNIYYPSFYEPILSLVGNDGADRLSGSGRGDILNGKGGADVMLGRGGDDTYFVDHVRDRVIEIDGEGFDRLASSTSYVLAAGQSIEAMQTTNTAGTAAINLTGNEVAQSILGNAGANRLDGGGGADVMRGYGGNDLYYVDNAGDRVFETAGQGSDTVAVSASYTLRPGQSIEVLQTTNTGGTGAISLAGNEIAQVVKGNNGANVIYGRGGSDVLYGYGGADTFVFDTAPGASNRDTIMDFSHAADTIRLDKSVFAALTVGNLAASAFKDIGVAGAVVDANDRILYNSDTGALFYDSNGSGAGGAVQFGTLFGHPNDINHLDFVIVA